MNTSRSKLCYAREITPCSLTQCMFELTFTSQPKLKKIFVTPMGKNANCHIQHASLWHEANSCKHVAHIFEQIHVNMLLISSQVFHSRWIATADMTLRYLCCVKSNQTTIGSKEGHEANQCMGRRHQNTTEEKCILPYPACIALTWSKLM